MARRNLNNITYLAPYRPLPWQVEPWRDKSPVLLLAGPAGTGKSRLAAEKMHAHPVSTYVNNVRNEGRECIAPVAEQ